MRNELIFLLVFGGVFIFFAVVVVVWMRNDLAQYRQLCELLKKKNQELLSVTSERNTAWENKNTLAEKVAKLTKSAQHWKFRARTFEYHNQCLERLFSKAMTSSLASMAAHTVSEVKSSPSKTDDNETPF